MQIFSRKRRQDARRRQSVYKYASHRALLKFLALEVPESEVDRYRYYLDQLPRNSIACRIRNRCIYTGKGNAVSRQFRSSRHIFKREALAGMLFGIRKSSW
jgi:small subunit ribosomal protein S14